jgi:hypothetical protein
MTNISCLAWKLHLYDEGYKVCHQWIKEHRNLTRKIEVCLPATDVMVSSWMVTTQWYHTTDSSFSCELTCMGASSGSPYATIMLHCSDHSELMTVWFFSDPT